MEWVCRTKSWGLSLHIWCKLYLKQYRAIQIESTSYIWINIFQTLISKCSMNSSHPSHTGWTDSSFQVMKSPMSYTIAIQIKSHQDGSLPPIADKVFIDSISMNSDLHLDSALRLSFYWLTLIQSARTKRAPFFSHLSKLRGITEV